MSLLRTSVKESRRILNMLRCTLGWRTPTVACPFTRIRVPARLSLKRRRRQQKLSNSNPL